MFSVLNLLALVIALISRANVLAQWTECYLTAAENSHSGVLLTNFQIKRMNKFSYVVEGPFVINENLSVYDCEMKLSYSSKGNSEFRLLPYKVPRQNCCSFFNSWFWPGVQKEIDAKSDLPRRQENAPICTTYSVIGNYSIHGGFFDKGTIPFPKYLVPGLYKTMVLYYKRAFIRLDTKFGFIVRFL